MTPQGPPQIDPKNDPFFGRFWGVRGTPQSASMADPPFQGGSPNGVIFGRTICRSTDSLTQVGGLNYSLSRVAVGGPDELDGDASDDIDGDAIYKKKSDDELDDIDGDAIYKKKFDGKMDELDSEMDDIDSEMDRDELVNGCPLRRGSLRDRIARWVSLRDLVPGRTPSVK